ncbi:hypothetical protein TI04_01965 [Achromatium sp. WMS2]|nr:hypothetical protein TI04_01965 [Achromatium sp. WMS2]
MFEFKCKIESAFIATWLLTLSVSPVMADSGYIAPPGASNESMGQILARRRQMIDEIKVILNRIDERIAKINLIQRNVEQMLYNTEAYTTCAAYSMAKKELGLLSTAKDTTDPQEQAKVAQARTDLEAVVKRLTTEIAATGAVCRTD